MHKLTFEQYCSEPAFPGNTGAEFAKHSQLKNFELGITRLEYFIAHIAPSLLIKLREENDYATPDNLLIPSK